MDPDYIVNNKILCTSQNSQYIDVTNYSPWEISVDSEPKVTWVNTGNILHTQYVHEDADFEFEDIFKRNNPPTDFARFKQGNPKEWLSKDIEEKVTIAKKALFNEKLWLKNASDEENIKKHEAIIENLNAYIASYSELIKDKE